MWKMQKKMQEKWKLCEINARVVQQCLWSDEGRLTVLLFSIFFVREYEISLIY